MHPSGCATCTLSPEMVAVSLSVSSPRRAAFDEYDRDQSGKIERASLRAALASTGLRIASAKAEALLAKHDHWQGAMEFDEFQRLCSSLSVIHLDDPSPVCTPTPARRRRTRQQWRNRYELQCVMAQSLPGPFGERGSTDAPEPKVLRATDVPGQMQNARSQAQLWLSTEFSRVEAIEAQEAAEAASWSLYLSMYAEYVSSLVDMAHMIEQEAEPASWTEADRRAESARESKAASAAEEASRALYVAKHNEFLQGREQGARKGSASWSEPARQALAATAADPASAAEAAIAERLGRARRQRCAESRWVSARVDGPNPNSNPNPNPNPSPITLALTLTLTSARRRRRTKGGETTRDAESAQLPQAGSPRPLWQWQSATDLVIEPEAAAPEAAMVAAVKEEGALDACAPVRRRRRSSAQTETEDKTEAGVSASVTHMGRAAACLGAHGRRRWG